MDKRIKDNISKAGKRQSPDAVFATKGTFPDEINLQWDAVDGAVSYVLQTSKGKTGKWTQIDIVTEPFYRLTGFDTEIEHFFRIAAVFPDKQGDWSEVFGRKLK